MSKERVNALSDGVFAILLTILILEFHPETIKPGHLSSLVLQQGPLFLMYVMSYFYVGNSWLFHHDYFIYVKHTTRMLNILNLLVLFTVTWINYAMVLLIETLTSGDTSDIQVAFIVYDIVAISISVSFLVIYRYLESHEEMHSFDGIEERYRRIRSDPIRSILIYLVSIGATFFSNLLAGALLFAGVIFHFVAYLRFSRVIHYGVTKSLTTNVAEKVVKEVKKI